MNGRVKVDGLEPKWMVKDDSERSFEQKWTVMGQSRQSFGINRSIEVDGSGPLSQTVHLKSFGPSRLIHDRPVSVDPRPFTLDLTHQNDRYFILK